MSFHREQLVKFVAAANVPEDEGIRIMNRAQIAIVEYSSIAEGEFSGGKIGYVLCNAELVTKFNTMYESGQLGR